MTSVFVTVTVSLEGFDIKGFIYIYIYIYIYMYPVCLVLAGVAKNSALQ